MDVKESLYMYVFLTPLMSKVVLSYPKTNYEILG